MCLGIPARIVAIGDRHPDVASVDMAGVCREVNIALLDGPPPVAVGDWILVHMGFALELMTEQEADEALRALDSERQAERDALAALSREGKAAMTERSEVIIGLSPSGHGGAERSEGPS